MINLPLLLERNRILRAVRGYFDSDGFIEVDTPILQLSPGMEIHLKAFETKLESVDGQGGKMLYLHTSPEFAMKKLVASGLKKIYQFSHVFRNEIVSRTHYPEFIMLEWYRAGVDYTALMEDCSQILALAAPILRRGELECRTDLTPDKLTVAEAFDRYAGIDIFATMGDRDRLAAFAAPHANITPHDSWDDIFDKLMMSKIEPCLGIGRPTILCEYPIHMAALSRPKPGSPKVAERFELYACSLELANAFSELTDAAAQRARFEADMAEKLRLYGKSYPIDSDFLSAVERMPETAGIALGIDRLIMLATSAPDIRGVLWSEIPGL